MLPEQRLPGSWRALLDAFTDCFTTPTFGVFTALMTGLVAQTGTRSVCGMWTAAGLSRAVPHDRAHRFFNAAVWSIDAIGAVVLRLIVTHLLPPDAPVELAVDDTAHRRTGRTIHGAGWVHDGAGKVPGKGRGKLSFGHRWVTVGVIVEFPFLTRPVCLPVACRRWKGKGTPSVVAIAADLITQITARLPDRRIDVVADAAYHGKPLQTLPPATTFTTRLPRTAVLDDLPPAPTGRRGRPRKRGARLGTPAQIAETLDWQETTVTRYGRTETTRVAVIDCLWYGSFATTPMRMICVADRKDPRALLALITTDLTSTPAQIVSRYATRWSLEVTFFDTRQTLGVGQARNRTPHAVERTWPLGMYLYSLILIWYATTGHHPQIVTDRQLNAPWYLDKTDPSFADILTHLRRVLITARFFHIHPAQPTPTEIRQVQEAWALAAA